MGHHTPLYKKHLAANAKIVDFGGWDMPLHYGSQLEEHHYVRREAGVFDVSHMTIIDVTGLQAANFLQYVLANNISKLKTPGKALYSCMLNEQGGVVDDLIAYKLGEHAFRLIVNASTREKDMNWLQKYAPKFNVQLKLHNDLGILAIQGPQAINKMMQILTEQQAHHVQALSPFTAFIENDWMFARTGYTGEEGLEVVVPVQYIEQFWDKLLQTGVHPCGLGARDTLRLEAGLNLYGADMDETTTPFESNLAWTVALDPPERDFVGRSALEAQRQSGNLRHLVGLVLEQRGVLRNHQKVIIPTEGEGEITSGSFSPTLQQAIALARIPVTTATTCLVEVRGQQLPARIVKPPFVRYGKNQLL